MRLQNEKAPPDSFLDLCCSLDELSDQEKQSESLPIAVQQLYTLIMLGRIEEAEKVSSDIVLQE